MKIDYQELLNIKLEELARLEEEIKHLRKLAKLQSNDYEVEEDENIVGSSVDDGFVFSADAIKGMSLQAIGEILENNIVNIDYKKANNEARYFHNVTFSKNVSKKYFDNNPSAGRKRNLNNGHVFVIETDEEGVEQFKNLKKDRILSIKIVKKI